MLSGGGREQLGELATQEGLIDLIIPRGGEGLKNALKAVAKVPVMYAAAGNCHVYVHEDADLEMARRIAYNAKVQRPGVATPPRPCWCMRASLSRCSRPCWPSWRGRGSSWSATSARARTPGRPRWARRPARTGTPSTTG